MQTRGVGLKQPKYAPPATSNHPSVPNDRIEISESPKSESPKGELAEFIRRRGRCRFVGHTATNPCSNRHKLRSSRLAAFGLRQLESHRERLGEAGLAGPMRAEQKQPTNRLVSGACPLCWLVFQ